MLNDTWSENCLTASLPFTPSNWLQTQLLKYSETVTQGKGHVLNMDNFIDTTNIEGRFEFSEWVRAYGKYLDEQLEVYHKIAFYQVQILQALQSPQGQHAGL